MRRKERRKRGKGEEEVESKREKEVEEEENRKRKRKEGKEGKRRRRRESERIVSAQGYDASPRNLSRYVLFPVSCLHSLAVTLWFILPPPFLPLFLLWPGISHNVYMFERGVTRRLRQRNSKIRKRF